MVQGTRVEPHRSAPVYQSLLTLEELASMDEEHSGQLVVRFVQESLKDPDIPVGERDLLGQQILALAEVLKERT